MSILSVDQISPIGSGTTITLNATEVKTGTEITVGTGASIFSPAGNTLTFGTNNEERIRIKNNGSVLIGDTNDGNAFSGGQSIVIGNTNSGTRTGVTLVSANDQDGGIYFSDGTSSGNANVQGQVVYNHSSNHFALYTAASERLRIDSSGRLGLGTIPTDYHSNNTAVFQLKDGGSIFSRTGGTFLGMFQNIKYNSSDVTQYITSNPGSAYFQTSGVHKFFTAASGTANNNATLNERLRIASNGDINVGGYGDNVAGLRYFDVQNNSSAANNHGSIIRLITSNAAGNSTTSVDIVKYKDGNFFINNNETSGSTNFNTGGSTRLTIHGSGYVTKPATPFFSVYGSASNVTYNQGDDITFENAVQNIGNHFKMTSGTGQYQRFIVPVDGVYIFTMGFFPNTASTCRISLAVNGGVQTNPYISGCFSGWGTGASVPMGSQMLKLTAGQYVTCRIQIGTLTNTYDGHTGFQGFLLG